jgi:hypothetical protein
MASPITTWVLPEAACERIMGEDIPWHHDRVDKAVIKGC